MITKIIPEAKIQKAKKIVERNDKFVIVAHVSPDGDAIGSSLGLYQFLLSLDKDVNVIVPDSLPSNLKWLKGSEDIVIYEEYPEFAAELIAKAEVIFCLDFNAIKRLEVLAPFVAKATCKKIMIDHHLQPDNFCDITISHPEISSTSELIFRFICRMGFFELMNRESAEAIYTGMMTDTGAFTYNSNNPEIYTIVGELLRKGLDKDQIYSNVFNTYTADRLRLMGYALNDKMSIFPEYQASLITLTQDELKNFNYQKGDSEGFVNIPLGISNVVLSGFFREDKEYIKVSLRSKGNFPANKVAEQFFNGGGHKNAAGGEFKGTMEEAAQLFVQILPLFKQYLKD